jgi:hypothetical protein
MIYKHRLEKLTEEELGVLLYCLNFPNENEDSWIYKYDKLPFLRHQFVSATLSKFGSNLSTEKKQFLQNIYEKLFTSK